MQTVVLLLLVFLNILDTQAVLQAQSFDYEFPRVLLGEGFLVEVLISKGDVDKGGLASTDKIVIGLVGFFGDLIPLFHCLEVGETGANH